MFRLGYWDVISILIGIISGIGVILAGPREVWPDINYGLQIGIFILGVFLYLFSVRKIRELSLKCILFSFIWGLFVAYLFKVGDSTELAIFLSLTSLAVMYNPWKGEGYWNFIGLAPLIASIPIGFLSVVAGVTEELEILSLIAIIIFCFWERENINGEEIRKFVPVFLVLGAWIFREHNGNIEFAGMDAAFVTTLAIVSFFAINYEKIQEVNIEDIEG